MVREQWTEADAIQPGQLGWDTDDPFDETRSTHLWIVLRAAGLAATDPDQGDAIKGLIPAHDGESGPLFHHAMCKAIYDADHELTYNDAFSFSSHFYDPDTGKNYLGSGTTAMSRVIENFNAAVERFHENDREGAGYAFGLALHYLTDLTQPMHAANYTFVDSYFPGFHTAFEDYVLESQNRAPFDTPNKLVPDSQDDPSYYVTKAAVRAKRTYWTGTALEFRGTVNRTTYSGSLTSEDVEAIRGAIASGMIFDAVQVTAQFIVAWARTVGLKFYLPTTIRWFAAGQRLVRLFEAAQRLGMTVYDPTPDGGYEIAWNTVDAGEGAGALAFLAVDMLGDGRTQIVQVWKDGEHIAITCYQPQPNGTYLKARPARDITHGAGNVGFIPVDMQGDGRTQIVQLYDNAGKSLGAIVYEPQDDGSYATGKHTPDLREQAGHLAFLPVHMQGDGKTQIAHIWDNGGRVAITVYQPRDDGSYQKGRARLDITHGSGQVGFVAVDMRGDGRTQIVQLYNNDDKSLGAIVYEPQDDGSYASGKHTPDLGDKAGHLAFLPVDMCGDGRTHIVQLWNNHQLAATVYQPQPDGSYAKVWSATDMGEGSGAYAFIALDVDGDGKTEIVQPFPNGPDLGLAVYRPTPDGGYVRSYHTGAVD